MARGYGRRDIGFLRRSVWDPFYESMRNAVPLILQNNRLDFKKSESDRYYQQQKAKLIFDADEAKLQAAQDIKLKELENENKLRLEHYEGALKTGNKAAQEANLSGTALEDLPTLTGATDDSLTEAEILWNASQGDINKFIRLSKRMQKGPEINTIAEALIDAKRKGDPVEIKYWEDLYKYSKASQKKTTTVSPGQTIVDEKGEVVYAAEPKDSKVSVWSLPNNEIVRSYDNGKTYIGKDGSTKQMPTEGAFKFSGSYTGTEIQTLKRSQRGQQDVPEVVEESGPTVKEAAVAGTGLWANMGAAFDAVAGGLGVDKLFGKNGFFEDTQEARQMLRITRQLGKSAFMNSSRGAIWEQQKIDKIFPNPDKIFTNPRTEAKKIKALRKALLTEREFNNKAIESSVDAKEIKRLEKSNQDINKLLSHFGKVVPPEPYDMTDEDEALIQKHLNQQGAAIQPIKPRN